MTTSCYVDVHRTYPVWKKSTRTTSQEIPLDRDSWILQAACRQGDPDLLFVKGAQQRRAATTCRPCHVRGHCLAAALDNREEFGVWGGLTERQRRALLRDNPHIKNWTQHLSAQGALADA